MESAIGRPLRLSKPLFGSATQRHPEPRQLRSDSGASESRGSSETGSSGVWPPSVSGSSSPSVSSSPRSSSQLDPSGVAEVAARRSSSEGRPESRLRLRRGPQHSPTAAAAPQPPSSAAGGIRGSSITTCIIAEHTSTDWGRRTPCGERLHVLLQARAHGTTHAHTQTGMDADTGTH